MHLHLDKVETFFFLCVCVLLSVISNRFIIRFDLQIRMERVTSLETTNVSDQPKELVPGCLDYFPIRNNQNKK